MILHILVALGGVGLFLFGMIVLTDGLRALAGKALRQALARYTTTPLSGVATGAITTAIIQSSSATTVTAVGFVGAGIITFTQALGIILGANIGTTITGWLVALIGFKLQLGLMVMPLVLLGVLMRLFGKGKVRDIGWALAGFSLLFIGIETMQNGMGAFEGLVTPENFPTDTLWGRFQLVLIGIGITIITQSSSAGIAATLVALSVGSVNFPQAAAMVIGMDVGTTFTAMLATIGGSVSMRQTAFAHVAYNLFAGTMAFCTLGYYTAIVDAWLGGGAAGNAQVAVVGFHTAMNVIGVIIVLPFIRYFARAIVRLMPERKAPFERGLDTALYSEPGAASIAGLAVAQQLTDALFALLRDQLDPARRHVDRTWPLVEIERGITAAEEFVENIPPSQGDGLVSARESNTLHILDHLRRLHHRCMQIERVDALSSDRRLERLRAVLAHSLDTYLAHEEGGRPDIYFDRVRSFMRLQRHKYRESTVMAATRKQMGEVGLLMRLDAVRWLQRVSYHAWRISHHFHAAQMENGMPATPPVEEGPEIRNGGESDDEDD
ncbi:Na/Pi cotransporter family protein [Kordiimonas lipolytica]|uniref:Na/Pi cotransporter family protein n=1 Tax=Kordiimonas lipolytica TaxID=1662421 RepID=A0ABV8UBD4_9PROT|nr:Na/Pi symporter [Kordiimonas lipolytica]